MILFVLLLAFAICFEIISVFYPRKLLLWYFRYQNTLKRLTPFFSENLIVKVFERNYAFAIWFFRISSFIMILICLYVLYLITTGKLVF